MFLRIKIDGLTSSGSLLLIFPFCNLEVVIRNAVVLEHIPKEHRAGNKGRGS